jgi:hypothetical protein
MIGAFNSVYTALQGFFSRSFWLAAFFPVALFAILHAIVGMLADHPISVFGVSFNIQKGVPADSLITAGPAVVLFLVVVANALVPFMPRFRGMLDGSMLPPWLHDWLRRARRKEARAILDERDKLDAELGAVQEMDIDAHLPNGELRMAFQAARALTSATNTAVVAAAQQALKKLNEAIIRGRPMAGDAEDALNAVKAALAANSPDARSVPLVDRTTAKGTNDVADRFEGLIRDAIREARYRRQILDSRIRVADALEDPRATIVGDARLVVERYANDVFQVDFNFLWPRLLAAMKAERSDDPMLEIIETSRSRVDFAILSLVLAASIPAIWLPLLLWWGGPAWLFLAIGAATPLVLGFFYELIFEGQLAFGDVVKTSIDKSRFLVLKMLRQPEPLSRGEERLLWRRIAGAEEDGRTTDLVYIPPSSGGR